MKYKTKYEITQKEYACDGCHKTYLSQRKSKYCNDCKVELMQEHARKPKKSKLIKEADILFSKLIRSKGECEYCGKKDNLQCAHILPRTNKHLRWNTDNAICLCYRHHIHWWHKNPLEAMNWFKTYKPIQYAFLMREKNKLETNLSDKSLEFIVKELKENLKEVS